MIFNTVGGGGGASLNYEVIGGTSAPSNPSENTIWINTSTTITSHIFSATTPSNPSTGMVWITVDASSTIKFSATEENPVMIYPVSAKQYVSGAWVYKTAKIYQGSKWVEWWNGELYKNGNEYTSVTGGWVGKALRGNSSGTDVMPTITRNTGNIVVSINSSTGGGVLHTAQKIDLTKYNTITFKGTLKGSSQYAAMGLCVWSSFGTYWKSASATSYVEGSKTVTDGTLDVSSLSGSYYVGFGVYVNASCTITEVILK